MTQGEANNTIAGTPFEVEFGRAGGAPLRLDVYPQAAGAGAPTVLYIHGGGWCGGDKRDDEPLFAALAAAGFVCVSPNYRLAPEHAWPACFEDVCAALAWTFEHAAGHGGDPDHVTVAGYSAGGHLALHLAVTQRDPRITGMAGLAAPSDWVLDNFRRLALSESMQKLFGQAEVDHAVLDRLWDASPINHLHPGVPRCLQIHGDADRAVPISQARHFHARLEQLGVASELLEVPGMDHHIYEPADHLPVVTERLIAWIRHGIPSPTTVDRH